jgi:hypothetical protein
LIQYLTKNIGVAMVLSAMLLLGYMAILGDFSTEIIINFSVLFLQGVILNYLCFRFGILGQNSSIPLVLFSIFSVLIAPQLSLGDLVYGIIWLAAFFLAFESGENPTKSRNYIIYFGILLGIAQTINNISVLLLLPVFILFIQTGARSALDFVLGISYFIMVVLSFMGVLFVMELEDKLINLIPQLTFDYSIFNNMLIKLFLPYVIASLIVHFLKLNGYRFRYPNRSKILNYTMLIQLGVAIALILFTAEASFLIYFMMPAVVILSFTFLYTSKSTFSNAAFLSFICIALGSLWLYKILIL